ncbi:MAG: type I-E CRISPR-associated protein Cas5/CasD [Planctomycetia bacterium]|nr:type I-E CRISPR-associated protein Cas5/CasD [Planctomycetia bacterium]
MSILLLRLAGPMQSWGIQSRFSVRDTGLEPSRSGVVGLLCCALGRTRDEPLDEFLPDKLAMGVRVDHEGRMARDWHTAQYVAKAGGGPPKDCEPSQRYYLADASFLVALRGEESFLNRLHEALQTPVWPLFLGRKAFVPSEPIWQRDGVLPDDDIEAALRRAAWQRPVRRHEPDYPQRLRLVLEMVPSQTASPHEVAEPRHDVPLSFADRRFTVRFVRTTWLENPHLTLPQPEFDHVSDEAVAESVVAAGRA